MDRNDQLALIHPQQLTCKHLDHINFLEGRIPKVLITTL